MIMMDAVSPSYILDDELYIRNKAFCSCPPLFVFPRRESFLHALERHGRLYDLLFARHTHTHMSITRGKRPWCRTRFYRTNICATCCPQNAPALHALSSNDHELTNKMIDKPTDLQVVGDLQPLALLLRHFVFKGICLGR